MRGTLRLECSTRHGRPRHKLILATALSRALNERSGTSTATTSGCVSAFLLFARTRTQRSRRRCFCRNDLSHEPRVSVALSLLRPVEEHVDGECSGGCRSTGRNSWGRTNRKGDWLNKARSVPPNAGDISFAVGERAPCSVEECLARIDCRPRAVQPNVQ